MFWKPRSTAVRHQPGAGLSDCVISGPSPYLIYLKMELRFFYVVTLYRWVYKVKVKVTLEQATKAQKRSSGIALLFS
jgi:hypothetical protein